MKRIVILIDGTWCDEDSPLPTNIAKLDPANPMVKAALIKPVASDGTAQQVFYHKGVGAESDLFKKILGGAIGIGLKAIVQDAYETVVENFAPGDELYLVGFSRGAYAARALGGLIGASGIQKRADPQTFDAAWANYRVRPAVRNAAAPASRSDKAAIDAYRGAAARGAFHDDRAIKCIAVFDTVGSYGVPAGFGLAAIARYWALFALGFHDTEIGRTVEVGLHAVAVDEHRRPFVPTFWTAPRGKPPTAHVEQTWFPGAHSNVGGGYAETGLSDAALIWMVARIEALTGLEFDADAVRAMTRSANVDGEVVDSSKGWIIDQFAPHFRAILAPAAVEHRAFTNVSNPEVANVGERVGWLTLKKRGRPCLDLGKPATPYQPPNLPASIAPAETAAVTAEEQALWPAVTPPSAAS
ncbi:putative alpha/beta hydrolase family protein DUF2235 [Roseiarcus fermentans]|uniref:Putative alpha/beta hydrolase family protein DUF2235 n=1 Tax=Roseiarcus fermentans TaxID=1473586 RepID=A0A366EI69_9HYPH|nr:DUF2235 domain-containing protein [Roseiarcus fermentans]RBP02112.1 putative alpha/beta hydrolase family protein DUF2235 [Roseiarcus fermentans]